MERAELTGCWKKMAASNSSSGSRGRRGAKQWRLVACTCWCVFWSSVQHRAYGLTDGLRRWVLVPMQVFLVLCSSFSIANHSLVGSYPKHQGKLRTANEPGHNLGPPVWQSRYADRQTPNCRRKLANAIRGLGVRADESIAGGTCKRDNSEICIFERQRRSLCDLTPFLGPTRPTHHLGSWRPPPPSPSAACSFAGGWDVPFRYSTSVMHGAFRCRDLIPYGLWSVSPSALGLVNFNCHRRKRGWWVFFC